jgi:hypothetical protein
MLLSPEKEGATSFYVHPESWVEVHGSSNITDFTCSIDGVYFADTIPVRYKDEQSSISFISFEFAIPVDKIGCGNRIMTKDMKRTLEEDMHPELRIRFLSYEPTGELVNGKWEGKLRTSFTIAGISKEYDQQVHVNYKGNMTLMNGKIPIDITEFNIKPKASVPLVKVADHIDIDFEFVMERLED